MLRARWYRGAVVLAAALLTGIAIAVAAQTVGIHAARVASGSMSPSIDRGDWIVVRDLDRNDGRTIRRGDVVVFSSRWAPPAARSNASSRSGATP